MRTIRYTSEASRQYLAILDWIKFKWGKRSANKLVHKVNASAKLICERPQMWPASSFSDDVRKCLVTKQTSLYYTFDAVEVVIVSVFDNRQDPKKLEKLGGFQLAGATFAIFI